MRSPGRFGRRRRRSAGRGGAVEVGGVEGAVFDSGEEAVGAEGVEAAGLEQDAGEAEVRKKVGVGGFEECEEAVAPGGDDAAAAAGAAEAEAGEG